MLTAFLLMFESLGGGECQRAEGKSWLVCMRCSRGSKSPFFSSPNNIAVLYARSKHRPHHACDWLYVTSTAQVHSHTRLPRSLLAPPNSCRHSTAADGIIRPTASFCRFYASLLKRRASHVTRLCSDDLD